MKKIIAILFAGLFALVFAACNNGGTPATTTSSPTQPTPGTDVDPGAREIYFSPNGVRMEMGAAPAPVLEALGEPKVTLECPSCALNAKDVDYTYPGFKLTVTYPEQGDDYITSIKLSDDTYTTPGGVTIGSTFEEVTAAYGTADKEETGFYYYIQDKSTLKITITNDQVAQILYEYDFD